MELEASRRYGLVREYIQSRVGLRPSEVEGQSGRGAVREYIQSRVGLRRDQSTVKPRKDESESISSPE